MANPTRRPTVRKRGKAPLAPGRQRTEDKGAPTSRGTFSPDGATGRQTSARSREADAQRTVQLARKRRRRRVAVAAASVAVAALCVAGLFAWDRFFRYDDAADIQGQWRVAEQNMTVVIDAEEIHMPASLSYPYQLDTWKKTISYDFAGYSGGGSYEFARDRQSFTITEGEGEDAASTTFVRIGDDLSATPELLAAPDEAGESPAGSGAAGESGAADGGAAGESGAADGQS